MITAKTERLKVEPLYQVFDKSNANKSSSSARFAKSSKERQSMEKINERTFGGKQEGMSIQSNTD